MEAFQNVLNTILEFIKSFKEFFENIAKILKGEEE